MQNNRKNLEFILDLKDTELRVELENWLRYETEKERDVLLNEQVEGARKFWRHYFTGR